MIAQVLGSHLEFAGFGRILQSDEAIEVLGQRLHLGGHTIQLAVLDVA